VTWKKKFLTLTSGQFEEAHSGTQRQHAGKEEEESQIRTKLIFIKKQQNFIKRPKYKIPNYLHFYKKMAGII
jgi:hypothetical protein